MESRGFTMVELLVSIGIIALISVIVVVVLNPVALLQQSRDSQRLADAETLNKAIGIYAVDVGGSLGTASTTYISIPDNAATSTAGDQCQGISTTTLMVDTYNWTDHCVSSANYRLANGNGWVPLNFGAISAGSPISVLPKDPLNAASTVGSTGYYTYAASGNQWAIAIPLESAKYLKQSAGNDGGYDPGMLEIGTNLSLVAQEEGLFAWWPFNETTGSSFADAAPAFSSAGIPTGTASGTTIVAGKTGNARSFNGTNDWAYINNAGLGGMAYPGSGGPGGTNATQLTIAFWAYVNSFGGASNQLFFESSPDSFSNPDAFRIIDLRGAGSCPAAGGIAFQYENGTTHSTFSIFYPEPSAGAWHHYVFQYNTQALPQANAAYMDGSPQSIISCGAVQATSSPTIDYFGSYQLSMMSRSATGTSATAGQLDDVRIYNSLLNASQVKQMYTAMN